jgi:hypothetical protein
METQILQSIVVIYETVKYEKKLGNQALERSCSFPVKLLAELHLPDYSFNARRDAASSVNLAKTQKFP